MDSLPLMEDFYTIQGEGFYQGQAAYFIRLGGCDVGCVWCDVKESWDVAAHPVVAVEEIAGKAKSSGSPMAVITGGEPAMHDLNALTAALKARGLRTNIETSGAYPLTGAWDWVCLSPKKFKSPHTSVLPLANELKVIVYNKSDFAWAEEYENLVPAACGDATRDYPVCEGPSSLEDLPADTQVHEHSLRNTVLSIIPDGY